MILTENKFTEMGRGYAKARMDVLHIMSVVCDHYGIEKMDRSKRAEQALVRFFTYYFSRKHTTATNAMIGLFVCPNKPFDHNSVRFGVKYIDDKINLRHPDGRYINAGIKKSHEILSKKFKEYFQRGTIARQGRLRHHYRSMMNKSRKYVSLTKRKP